MSGIELIGIDQMLADIRERLGNAAARLESKGLKVAGEIIAEEERRVVPVSDRSGPHVRDDIYVTKVIRKDGQKYVLVRTSKKTSWRLHWIEFGTSEQPARPFKEPAFHAKKREALQVMADEFRKGLRE